MKNEICLKKHTIWRTIIAAMLSLTLMVLVGCEAGQTSSESNNSSTNNTSSNNSSGSNDTLNPEVDRLAGKVSYGYDVVTKEKRDDDGEILPQLNDAFKENPLTGYYEKEADALRQKILNTGNTEEYYKITGTKYYISPGGDDTNPGTSPDKALRTPEGISNLDLKKGDAILFERGAVFRATTSIVTTKGVIYGSYGKGDKPKIYGSAQNFAEVDWKPSKRKNVWQISYVYDPVGNIVFNHGEEVGALKTAIKQLEKNGQFFHDEVNNILYLYCDKGDPSKIYKSIEACASISIFYITGGNGEVVIDNICLMYCSGFGVRGANKNYDITITNCEMGFLGGYRRSTGRLGNAIQIWNGSDDLTVKNNWIYQTFDTAVTWQGHGGKAYTDTYIVGNLFEYNHTDIEIWDHAPMGAGHAEVENCVISDNISRFCTLGWGSRANDAGTRGFDAFLFAADGEDVSGYDEAIIKDKIIVKNNIIDTPGSAIINWTMNPKDWGQKYDISGNKIYINSKLRLSNQVLRGFKKTAEDAITLSATNTDELIAAMQRFDPTISAIWN